MLGYDEKAVYVTQDEFSEYQDRLFYMDRWASEKFEDMTVMFNGDALIATDNPINDAHGSYVRRKLQKFLKCDNESEMNGLETYKQRRKREFESATPCR